MVWGWEWLLTSRSEDSRLSCVTLSGLLLCVQKPQRLRASRLSCLSLQGGSELGRPSIQARGWKQAGKALTLPSPDSLLDQPHPPEQWLETNLKRTRPAQLSPCCLHLCTCLPFLQHMLAAQLSRPSLEVSSGFPRTPLSTSVGLDLRK